MPPSPSHLHQSPHLYSSRRGIPTQVLAPSNWTKPPSLDSATIMLSCQPRLRSMSKLACTPVDNYKDSRQLLLGSATEMRVQRRPPLQDEMETVREEFSEMQESIPTSGGRIMVYVRMRPMSKTEKDSGGRCCVRIVNKKDVYLTEFASETDYLRLKRLKGRHFVFDAAFTDVAAQQEVYNISTAELVEGVLQGRNGSVFCYGATGAGKTHTMLGTTQSPGVMVLALRDLFAKLRQRCREGDYTVRLSYLEVYNESVRDLLSPGRPLVLREDSKQGIVATGLTHYEAYSADEVMALLHQGNQNRTTEPTRANETSSRSHAILQVSVELKMVHQHESQYVCRTGKLSLIDLAGSERALATDQRSIRSLEGANINRSLLALSSCINALVEGKKHIPFRNSKLTQLLKDSLGGACQTAMIANISPSNLTFGETQNTLHWADRAKQIRTKSCPANEETHAAAETDSADQAKLLLEVQKENQQLRLQLARMQQKLLSMESSAIMIARHSPAPTTPQRPVAVCRTPNTIENKMASTRASSRHDECRAAEEILRRKVQELEQERDEALRELAERDAQASVSIAALERGHNLQLRHKEEVIRTLCNMAQKNLAASGDAENASSAAGVPNSQQKMGGRSVRRMTTGGGGGGTTTAGATAAFMSGCARRMSVGGDAARKPPASAAMAMASCRKKAAEAGEINNDGGRGAAAMASSQQRKQQQQQESSRRLSSRIPSAPAPPPKTPTSSSKEAMKKRTFWDITNANSPSAQPSRCTRSNTAAMTPPSMLLQPGFMGGTGRRRLLQ